MNKLCIIDAEELARRNRSFFLWAIAAEIVWLAVGIFIGAKFGPDIAAWITWGAK